MSRSYTSSPPCASIDVLWDFFTFAFTQVLLQDIVLSSGTAFSILFFDHSAYFRFLMGMAMILTEKRK
jgi:hypothetical protein